MILNFRMKPLSVEAMAFVGGRCFVDGAEVKQVWYIDTELGVVKSYDLMGDGKPHVEYECLNWPAGAERISITGLMSITRHGKVEVVKP